tara:strand:- start:427 stop:651 length:225 start_codon:yes stop_codon:yes gene_type:complete
MIETKHFPPYGYAEIDSCNSPNWDFIVSLYSPTHEYDELGKVFLEAIKSMGNRKWLFVGTRMVVVGESNANIPS